MDFYERLFKDEFKWKPNLGGLGFNHIGGEEREWLERTIEEKKVTRR